MCTCNYISSHFFNFGHAQRIPAIVTNWQIKAMEQI